jgi:predicted nucleotidyltransferase
MNPPDVAIDRNALAAVSQAFDLNLVLLYGSRVTGHLHRESDVDLGVWRRRGPLPASQFFDLSDQLSQFLPPETGELDLADLNRASGLLKHIAAEQGTALYEAAPGDLAHFRVLAWNLYQDERIAIRRHDSRALHIALRSMQP